MEATLDGLSVSNLLSILAFTVSDSATLCRVACVSTRLNIVANLDSLWVAAFVSRRWGREFPTLPPLLRCLPRPVAFDGESDLPSQRPASGEDPHGVTGTGAVALGAVRGGDTAPNPDPHDPTSLVEWAVVWPCQRGPGLLRRMPLGSWKRLYRDWLAAVVAGVALRVARGLPATSGGSHPVGYRSVLPSFQLKTVLSDRARSLRLRTEAPPPLPRRASEGHTLMQRIGGFLTPSSVDHPSVAAARKTDGTVSVSVTVPRVMLVGFPGAGRRTILRKLGAARNLQHVKSQVVTAGLEASLHVNERCILTSFPVGEDHHQGDVYWQAHSREADALMFCLDAAVIDGDDANAVHHTLQYLGDMLAGLKRPLPPVVLLANKQDAVSAVPSDMLAVLAQCTFAPPDLVWMVAGCVARTGLGLAAPFDWLLSAVEVMGTVPSDGHAPPAAAEPVGVGRPRTASSGLGAESEAEAELAASTTRLALAPFAELHAALRLGTAPPRPPPVPARRHPRRVPLPALPPRPPSP